MNRRRRAAACMLWVTLAACTGMVVHHGARGLTGPLETPALVQTCRVSLGCVERVVAADGVVGYEQEFAVPAPRAGYVAQLCVAEGDTVARGDLIARMDAAAQEAWTQSQLATAAEAAQPLLNTRASLVTDALQQSIQVNEMAAALEASLVRAPADGVIRSLPVSTMTAVAAGTPVAVMGGSGICVRMTLVEKDASEVRKGLHVRVLKGGEQVAEGRVTHVSPLQPRAETGTAVATVTALLQGGEALTPGAVVEAEIVLERRNPVARLPISAITEDETLWWVADGRCWEIPAQRLMTGDEACWVPLQEGAAVVVGAKGLLSGQRVKEDAP